MKISGRIVDIHRRSIYSGAVRFEDGRIIDVVEEEHGEKKYIMPGLIDAHVHIESSMLTPYAFAQTASAHGTVGCVSDPHEIANVLGVEGVEYMMESARESNMRFWFGAPSCVPATIFESSGAAIGAGEVRRLLENPGVKYLSEMMNFPGVIYGQDDVLEKLKAAKDFNKPVDGHAPGLSGEGLRKYVAAGISTDHECSTADEAREKVALGMKILIREGSAARNLDALKVLINEYPEMCMLCSDDLHPEMLLKRHMNKIVSRLVSEGFDLFDVLACCTINPVKHYSLDAGLMRPGDPADFIVVDSPGEMNVIETWINGEKVFPLSGSVNSNPEKPAPNRFNSSTVNPEAIQVPYSGEKLKIIECFDGELLTRCLVDSVPCVNGKAAADPARDILKIVVKDRYNDNPPAIGFIKGFGLKSGAMASSVAHDSHNIIAVGADDSDICRAVNEIVRMKGGLAVAWGEKAYSLPLPVGGIMSDRSCGEIASKYEELSELVKTLGTRLNAPFMTLSFMALLVIPELKLSDRGLFDGNNFKLVPLIAE